MRMHILFVLVILLTSSCASYQANLENSSKNKYGVTTGKPVWEKSRSSKNYTLVAPLAGASAGYLLSKNQTLMIGDKVYSDNETRTLYALGGMVVGVGVNYLIKKIQPSQKTYNTRDQDKWLYAYNKSKRSNYIFPDAGNNSDTYVSIMMRNKYDQYTNDYDEIIINAKNGQLNFRQQDQALEKLDREFSVLSNEKQRILKSTITNAKEIYAEKTIVERINQIETLSSDLDRARKYSRLKTDYYQVFQALPLDKQEEYSSKIFDGLDASITNDIKVKRSEIRKFSQYDLSKIKDLNQRINEYTSLIKPIIMDHYFDDQSYFSDLTNLKTIIVSNNIGKINDRISNASTIDQLKSINDTYLLHCNTQEKNISKLSKVLNLTEDLILLKLQEEAEKKKLDALYRKKTMLNETTATGEPTEAQIQFAIVEQMRLKKEQVERMANVSPDDPFLLLAKAFGGLANQTDVELISLYKIGCKESQMKPGYVCDYTIDTSVKNGPMANTFNQLNNVFGNAILTGRFLKVRDEWMLVEQISK